MRVVVVTPPQPLVSVPEAKAHLRVSGSAEDTVIEAMVAAASQHIDGPAGWLGRAIGTQTLEARLDLTCYPGMVRLSYPPITGIVSVRYLDGAGTEVIADPATYQLIDDEVIAIGAPAWVNIYSGREALRVRFTAGYSVIPAPIKAAVLLMVGDLYRNRETAAAQINTSVPMSTTVDALLGPYRVFR